MNPKKAVKDLEKQLRKDPHNLVLRVRLAGALYNAGRWPEAIDLYQSVALAYKAQGRVDQAIAVCHGLLEIAPDHAETHRLLGVLNAKAMERVSKAMAAPPVEPEPEQVRRRPPARPSGFETDNIAPGSEPEMLNPQRVKRDSQLQNRGAARRTGRLALPLPHDRSDSLSPTPTPTGDRVVRARLSDRQDRRDAVTVPEPKQVPARADPDSDDDAPTRIADRTGSLRAALPIRKISFSDPGAEPRGRTPPASGEARSSRVTTPQGPGPGLGRSRPRDTRTDATRERYTTPRGRQTGTGSRGGGSVTDPGARPSTVTSVNPASAEFDDHVEVSRAFGSSFPTSKPSRTGPSDGAADVSILPGLPAPAARAIAEGLNRYRVAAGDLILREGEAGDNCFILSRGEARVLKRDPTSPGGEVVEVSRLGVGDLFGEVALLSDQRRHATVQAVSECDLLEIPREHLRSVTERFPEVAAYLDQFYRERLIATLVGTAPFFQPLEQSERDALVGNFHFSRVEIGSRIVEEGQRAGGFYLIVLGSVEITKVVSEHRQVLLATLGEGSYFGEMSLLRGDSARATVTAMGPTELAILPAKNFYALVASHPILWDQVRQEAHRRELEIVQIVTGVTGAV